MENRNRPERREYRRHRCHGLEEAGRARSQASLLRLATDLLAGYSMLRDSLQRGARPRPAIVGYRLYPFCRERYRDSPGLSMLAIGTSAACAARTPMARFPPIAA